MKLKDLGGEFALINRIARQYDDQRLVMGIGDDCALLDWPKGQQLVTTDMMVEGDHFRTDWSSPQQIGGKLMESNVSDIVCKGGTPVFAFLSLCLTKETTVAFMDGFYEGLYASAARHGVMLVGGDTTHGDRHVLNLTLIGTAGPRTPRRSGAQVGDLLCVTGRLGGSTAGLKLLLHGQAGDLEDHVNPRSRTVAEGRIIARHATATIDVSDGLGSETRHICEQSGCGARIDRDRIPLSAATRETADRLGLDAYDFALYGGEDFEIVFTLPPARLRDLRAEFDDFTVVGEMLPATAGISLMVDGRVEALKRGYDHFA